MNYRYYLRYPIFVNITGGGAALLPGPLLQPLPSQEIINNIENLRKEAKRLADRLIDEYRIRFPDGPLEDNPPSVGMDINGNSDIESLYNRERIAANNLLIIENEIKDIIEAHTDYTDEDIFEALDVTDYNIRDAIQYCNEL